jgi:Leucine-rich repeat (LRR) protein
MKVQSLLELIGICDKLKGANQEENSDGNSCSKCDKLRGKLKRVRKERTMLGALACLAVSEVFGLAGLLYFYNTKQESAMQKLSGEKVKYEQQLSTYKTLAQKISDDKSLVEKEKNELKATVNLLQTENKDLTSKLEKENSEYKKLPSPDDLVSANINDSSETLFRNEYKAYEHIKNSRNLSVNINIRDNHVGSLELSTPSSVYELKKMPWEILDLAYLQKLDIAGHSLTSIDGVDNLTQLAELNLRENQIGRISGLDKLSKLGYLYLNENAIVKIEGLDNLTQLKYLDLSKNQIVKIEGLSNLAQLKKLDLDDNKIKRLEGFDNLKALKEISILRNPIDYKDTITKKTLADLERRGVAVYRDE